MIAILLGYGARFLMAWPGCSNSSSSELEPQTHGQIASGPTPRRANTNEAQSEVPRDRKATARETGRVQMSPSPPLPCHGSSLSPRPFPAGKHSPARIFSVHVGAPGLHHTLNQAHLCQKGREERGGRLARGREEAAAIASGACVQLDREEERPPC